jgi:sulfate adenylyltransferase subunit 1
MKWYDGPTLMYLLENVHISGDHNLIDMRFPCTVRRSANEYRIS